MSGWVSVLHDPDANLEISPAETTPIREGRMLEYKHRQVAGLQLLIVNDWNRIDIRDSGNNILVTFSMSAEKRRELGRMLLEANEG